VVFTKIPVGGTQPSMSYKKKTTFPKLLSRMYFCMILLINYYLVLRGTGTAPCNVDAVLASYRVII
jgi:hypothetical protein